MEHFEIEEEWREALTVSGLGDFQSCLAFQGGTCLSSHRRGDTRKITLSDGRVVFLKRDFFTFKKEIAKDLLFFRKPQPKTEKERLAFAMALDAGFTAPKVIAWGQTRHCGFPDTACLIMLPLDGVDLDKYLKSETDITKGQEFILKAERTLLELQKHGFDWPDHKPEHFFVMNDGSIGLIDLERMRFIGGPLCEAKCAAQLARFRSLLPKKSLETK